MINQDFLNSQKFHVVVIVVLVMALNWQGVFGLDILLDDDNGRYSTVVNSEYQQTLPFRSFLGLRSEVRWLGIKVLAYSAPLARFLVLTLFMVPLSLLFYLFNRRVLFLSSWVALSSAVIVQIIPGLHEFPAFVDASYPVHGLLAFLTALWLSRVFLNSETHRSAWFALWFFAWVLTNDLMMEMGIFLFPALLFFIYISPGQRGRKLWIYISGLLIVLVRLWFYLNTLGHPHNSASQLAFDEIVSRIAQSIEWWLPIPIKLDGYHLLVLAASAAVVFAAYREKIKKRLSRAERRALSFYMIWFVSTAFPFWFLSLVFTPRYFYVAFFGLTTIAMIPLYALLMRSGNQSKRIAGFSLIVLFLIFGVMRFHTTSQIFGKLNLERKFVIDTLKSESFDHHAQIAMIMDSHTTQGYYRWSSGYFQFIFGNPTIKGQMGPEYFFYDAFNLKACDFRHRMSCLDPDQRLIAYRDGRKMRYFLQWKQPGFKDSPWALYRSDRSDYLQLINSGSGKGEYIQALHSESISSEDVLWGALRYWNIAP